MKKYILLVILMITSILSYSQEVIEYKGDTLVAITPQNLKTINTIITEYEFTKEELNLYKQSSFADSVLIKSLNGIIQEKDSMIDKKINYYTEINKSLEVIIEKEKKKHRLTKTLLGGAAVGIGILLLTR